MANILITGGTGLVGAHLSQLLNQDGHKVSHLSRSPRAGGAFAQYAWDVKEGTIDPKAFVDVDHIIHLAGAGVADKRWTDERKKEIMDSRVESTKLLFEKANEYGVKLQSYISASAVGYYGSSLTKSFSEDSKPGDDFLAKVVQEWEAAADLFSSITRVAKVRIGVVLAKEAGALAEISKPVKFGVGAPLGHGKQWMSWIHVKDLAGIFKFALENKLEGTFNAVAPHPVSNEQLTKATASVLKKTLWLPNVPAFVMKLMLGEMSEIVLKGNKVESEKIETAGYTFHFTYIDAAIKDLLGNQ